jgi:hypothetical protein
MNPFSSLFKSFWYLITGRLRFDAGQVGQVFVGENGQRFRAFRYAALKPGPSQPPAAGAVFIPYFHVSGMPVRVNMLFSLIPMWFILGLPGFRSKFWLVNDQTGDFCGYYEWDRIEDAQAYSHSFAARFMFSRSIPGSVRFRIYPADQAPARPGT